MSLLPQKMFQKMAQVDNNYFLCDMEEQMVSGGHTSHVWGIYFKSFLFQELASTLSSIPMPLMDHFYFSMAPVDLRKKSVVSALCQVS